MSNITKAVIAVVLAGLVGAVVIARRSRIDPTVTASVTATQPTTALPRLLDLGAGKCIPCKKMAPILEELRTEMAGQIQVDFIDVWQNPDAGEQYHIALIPTQIFYDASGKELSRHEGFMARQDILDRFREHGIALWPKAE